MSITCQCPAATAIPDVPNMGCAQSFGQIQKVAFTRLRGATGTRDGFIVSESKGQIEKLESELETKVDFETDRLVKLPFDALETANMLINATYRRKVKSKDRLHCCDGYKITTDMYSVDDLEQIAEHLLVYCKHNKEREE